MVRLIAAVLGAALVAGCSGDSATPPGDAPAATPAVFNAAGEPTVELSVPDMVCESCTAKVHEVLAGLHGAKEVKVDLATKTATVAVVADAFDADAAAHLLADDYGFPNTHLKTADDTPATDASPATNAAPATDADPTNQGQ